MENEGEANKWENFKEQIMKDRQAIKRLKDSCENIKKILSNAETAVLFISNFYKKCFFIFILAILAHS